LIYTVTFNPSLDYIVRLDQLLAGTINRVSYENVLPGGKGINVSFVLKNLGQENTALGFTAGFTGDEIERALKAHGVRTSFVRLDEGFSRINVKAKDARQETEINGQGPDIPEKKQQELFTQLDALQDGDTLVLAGSIPRTLPDDIYERILASVRKKGKDVRVVVDAERNLLLNVLPYHPFLIKPNNHELGAIFGQSLTTDEEIEACARELKARGAQNVLISMAGDGAMLIPAEGPRLRLPAPKGTLVNSVGAGDSMVAGFLTGWDESGGKAAEAFRWGIATGSASAFSENLATRPEVEALLASLPAI
jgi:1-phosphofructokinase